MTKTNNDKNRLNFNRKWKNQDKDTKYARNTFIMLKYEKVKKRKKKSKVMVQDHTIDQC